MTRKFFSWALYCGAVITIVIAVAATLLSFLLKDLKYYTELTLERIEKTTHYSIAIDDIHLSFTRGAGILIHNLSVMDTERRIAIFKSRKIHVIAEIIPLLTKNIRVSRIVLENPEVILSRSPDGKWATLRLPPPDASQPARHEGLADFSISLKTVVAHGGRIVLDDGLFDSRVVIDQVNLMARRTGHTYMVRIAAQNPAAGDPGKIRIEGSIRADPENPRRSPSAEGTLTLSAIILDALQPYLRDLPVRPAPALVMDGRLSFSLMPGWFWRVQGRATFNNAALVVQHQKTIGIGPLEVDLTGTVQPDAVRVDTFTCAVPQALDLRGAVDLTGIGSDHEKADLRLADGDISIPFLLQRLIPALPALSPYASRLQAISTGRIGVHNVHIRGSGKPFSLRNMDVAKADLELHDLNISVPAPLPPLRFPVARLTFDNQTMHIDADGHMLDNDAHRVQATITSMLESPRGVMVIDSSCPVSSLNVTSSQPAFRRFIASASGRLMARAEISYDRAVNIGIRLNATEASYRITNSLSKPVGLVNTLVVSAAVAEPHFQGPVEFEFIIDKTLSLKGTMADWGKPAASGFYSITSLPLQCFEFPSMSPELAVTGSLSGNGSFSFDPDTPRQVSLTGPLTLDGFTLQLAESGTPLIQADVSARSQPEGIVIKKARARVGETHGRVSGTLTRLDPLTGPFTIEAEKFDIDGFVQTVGLINNIQKRFNAQRQHRQVKKSIFRRTDFDANLSVKNIKFLRWNAVEGSSRFIYKNSVMSWDNIVFRVGQGTVNGTVRYDFRNPGAKILKLMPARSNIPITWVIPGLKLNETITGTMDATGEFSSTFTNGQEILPNMRGDFRVDVSSGVIKKFTVLSKILTMLDLASLLKFQVPDLLASGMPFDSVHADFTMQNGIMKTDNFILLGPAMNLTAVGAIDTVNQELDFTVGAQPLKTISKILGNIPIARGLLRGESKGLTVGYFQVRGPCANPSVTALTARNLSSGIVKFFKSILDIPRDILSSKQKPAAPSDNGTFP